GFNQEIKQPEFETFFPEFCLGDKNPECGERHFIEILDGLLRTGNLTEGEEPWWKDVFIPEQMMPFAIVYVDEATDDENGDRAATSESRGTTRDIHGTDI